MKFKQDSIYDYMIFENCIMFYDKISKEMNIDICIKGTLHNTKIEWDEILHILKKYNNPYLIIYLLKNKKIMSLHIYQFNANSKHYDYSMEIGYKPCKAIDKYIIKGI